MPDIEPERVLFCAHDLLSNAMRPICDFINVQDLLVDLLELPDFAKLFIKLGNIITKFAMKVNINFKLIKTNFGMFRDKTPYVGGTIS